MEKRETNELERPIFGDEIKKKESGRKRQGEKDIRAKSTGGEPPPPSPHAPPSPKNRKR